MRRLRNSGIVTLMLLGLTGCAGVQQRLGWNDSPTLVGADDEGRPLSRLAFWRRSQADGNAASSTSSDVSDSARSTMIAGNGHAADDDEERPGLLRRLPLVGRFLKGGHRDESDELDDMPASRYSPGALNAQPVAFTSPRTSTNAPAAAANASPSATTPATASNSEPPVRELTVDLAGNKPEVDAAAIPARNGAPAADVPPPIPGMPVQQDAPGMLPTPPPVQSLGREDVPPPTAAPGLDSPELSPAPTTNRTPATPAPSVSAPPSSGSDALTSTPGPIMPLSTVTFGNGQTFSSTPTFFGGSSQSVVMSSSQGGYVSGGCESPCGPKCKTHKVCPLKKHKQAVYESSVVMPSAQGTVSSCEAAPCKVKKECFLKAWLHHKSGCKLKGCKGCKSCAYCGEAPSMVSSQSPLVSSQW